MAFPNKEFLEWAIESARKGRERREAIIRGELPDPMRGLGMMAAAAERNRQGVNTNSGLDGYDPEADIDREEWENFK